MDDEGSNEEGKSIKVMTMALRVVGSKVGYGIGNKGGMQQRRQW